MGKISLLRLEMRLEMTAPVLGLLLVMLAAPAARGEEPRLLIGGYDPVAYSTDGTPVRGNAEFKYLWAPAALALRQRRAP